MLTGHCECGGVRFRVDGAIHDYSHCHCSQCRRLHGAAFASYIGVRRDELHWLEGRNLLRHYASSPGHDRVFCNVCGSSLLVAIEAEPDDYYLALGAVDDAPSLPEAYHIFVGSKAPWWTISDGLRQYEEDS